MIKKYKFTIATTYINSAYSEEKEIEFDDNSTKDEIEDQVCEIYNQWLNEKNYGGFEEVKNNVSLPLVLNECSYFIPDKNTNATKCKNCGKDRRGHVYKY